MRESNTCGGMTPRLPPNGENALPERAFCGLCSGGAGGAAQRSSIKNQKLQSGIAMVSRFMDSRFFGRVLPAIVLTSLLSGCVTQQQSSQMSRASIEANA